MKNYAFDEIKEKVLFDQEEENGDNGCRWHGQKPGAENFSGDLTVDTRQSAGKADAENGADQSMGGGYRQFHAGTDQYCDCGGNIGSHPA